MKYIDAEKLIAEIERLHKAHSGKYGCDEVGLNLEYLEDFITNLPQEQPEVDLEKELKRYLTSDEYLDTPENVSLLIARHFYNLGLKAKKEE